MNSSGVLSLVFSCVLLLFSLHIHSMWETICDAWACWSGWNFGPNSTEYPYSEIQFQNTPLPRKWKLSEILALWLFSFRIPPPPKKNENCQRSYHFDFSVSEYPPPPPKWKLSEILALWLFCFRIPLPWKWKLSEILSLWLFSFRIPPSPQKWKLSEILALWLFSFRIPPPPPPPGKLKFGQILALQDFSVSELCVSSYHMWRLYPARITTRSCCEDFVKFKRLKL